MLPWDGANDSPVELSFSFIDTSLLAPGRHTVFVHGYDTSGYLGPAGALFVDIP